MSLALMSHQSSLSVAENEDNYQKPKLDTIQRTTNDRYKVTIAKWTFKWRGQKDLYHLFFLVAESEWRVKWVLEKETQYLNALIESRSRQKYI